MSQGKPPAEKPIYSAAKLNHRFPALWLLAALLKLFACLSIPIGFTAALKAGSSQANAEQTYLVVFAIFGSALIGFLFWGASDFLKLLLCLEYNTDQQRDSRAR